MTHTCVSNQTIIGWDNGVSPGRRQAIIWSNGGIIFIRTLGTNFSEMLSKKSYIVIHENSFQNVVCEMAAILSRSQCVKTLTPGKSSGITMAQVPICLCSPRVNPAQSHTETFFIHWPRRCDNSFNSMRPSDAYMRRESNHHWFK